MQIPRSELIQLVIVSSGADVADHEIVARVQPGDIVITGDIPLAARVVEKLGIALGTRGELYDDDSVHGRLATRNMMEHMRSAGVETGGPKPLSQKDIQTFANRLDSTLTRCLKKKRE